MTTEIYTDGSCLGNPGIGGWAFVVVHSDGVTCRWANSQCNTTNNVMELTAALKALEHAQEKSIQNIQLYTDSNYLKNGMTQWLELWKQNDWKTSNGKCVKNTDVWKSLDSLNSVLNVQWIHVKAHAYNYYNNMVDKLANEAAHGIVTDVEY
jgi:ribonuclease HI